MTTATVEADVTTAPPGADADASAVLVSAPASMSARVRA
jgi:hypothetical protein